MSGPQRNDRILKALGLDRGTVLSLRIELDREAGPIARYEVRSEDETGQLIRCRAELPVNDEMLDRMSGYATGVRAPFTSEGERMSTGYQSEPGGPITNTRESTAFRDPLRVALDGLYREALHHAPEKGCGGWNAAVDNARIALEAKAEAPAPSASIVVNITMDDDADMAVLSSAVSREALRRFA